MRRTILAASYVGAALSACGSIVLLGLVSGPGFTGPMARAADWLFLAALVAFAVLAPIAAAVRWAPRPKTGPGTTLVWVPVAVLAWNLAWIFLLRATNDSLFAYALDQRGGWVARRFLGQRPAPPAPNETSARAVEPAPGLESASYVEPPRDQPSRGPAAPSDPNELLRCALRARLAATTFGGYDYLDAGAECVTRELAAALGSGTAASLGLSSAFVSMGKELKGLLKGGVSEREKERTKEEGARLEGEIERALRPWGVTTKDLLFGRKKDLLVANGRRFLREMSALKRRLEPGTEMGKAHRAKCEEKGLPPGSIDPDLVAGFADEPAAVAEFEPPEGGRRSIKYRGKPPIDDRWELAYEDGAWRASYLGRAK